MRQVYINIYLQNGMGSSGCHWVQFCVDPCNPNELYRGFDLRNKDCALPYLHEHLPALNHRMPSFWRLISSWTFSVCHSKSKPLAQKSFDVVED